MAESNIITAPNDLRNNKVDMLSTKNINMKNRRVINADDAQDKQDYVTLNDLQTRLAPSAYTDTTIASNIVSGTLPNGQVPAAQYTALGGLKALVPVTHKVVTGLDTNGNLIVAQVDYADLTGSPVTAYSVPSIVLGTIYHNATLKPLFIQAVLYSTSAGTLFNILTGATSPPGNSAGQVYSGAATQVNFSVFFIVLPGWYYEITQGGGTGGISGVVQWT